MQGAASCYIQLNDVDNAAKYFEMAADVHPSKEFYMNAGIARFTTGCNYLFFTIFPQRVYF